MFLRLPDARFSAANFIRAQFYSVFASLRTGMDILTGKESVEIDLMNGHGGFFREEGIGQRVMAAALNKPVTIMETAGEGGPWGMAILAAYMVQKKKNEPLSDYLAERVFHDNRCAAVLPDPAEAEGFELFLKRYNLLLKAERAALEII